MFSDLSEKKVYFICSIGVVGPILLSLYVGVVVDVKFVLACLIYKNFERLQVLTFSFSTNFFFY